MSEPTPAVTAEDDRVLLALYRIHPGRPVPWTRGAVDRLTAAGLVELVPLGTWRLTDAGRCRAGALAAAQEG